MSFRTGEGIVPTPNEKQIPPCGRNDKVFRYGLETQDPSTTLGMTELAGAAGAAEGGCRYVIRF